MAFEIPQETNSGKITEVTVGATSDKGGTRSHTITIGGSNALPLHFFEGEHPHRPLVAMEVFDSTPGKYPESLLEYYGDVIDKPGEMAKKCVDDYGA
ncbi:MAG: acetyl-CoA decarbonylase/synthase complex subunit delta, partial [Deltaproteobacteria bacterium]|nr:acetyl-CoA decarbonylase/synthase complex subunit delta [Deltaproteobacteria bacterium]